MASTPAEQKLWEYLKTKPCGVKFRRQHPFGPFIVDFYAHAVKLVIEADGGIHDQWDVAVADKLRQEGIESDGIIVIRFRNEEIFSDFQNVCLKIEEQVNSLLLQKSNSNTE
jgi:very-short-patch-repair endonuclease